MCRKGKGCSVCCSTSLFVQRLCAPGFWEMLARPPELVKHQHWSLLGDTG